MCQKTIKSICYQEAKKSPCVYKLGCVITKGRNKVVCRGFNNNKRSSYLGKITCCQHAEMAAATKFYNQFIRRNQIKVSC